MVAFNFVIERTVYLGNVAMKRIAALVFVGSCTDGHSSNPTRVTLILLLAVVFVLQVVVVFVKKSHTHTHTHTQKTDFALIGYKFKSSPVAVFKFIT
jgi:hypothetical protein